MFQFFYDYFNPHIDFFNLDTRTYLVPKTLNPSNCIIQTFSDNFPFKNAHFTSIWWISKSSTTPSASIVLIITNLTTSAHIHQNQCHEFAKTILPPTEPCTNQLCLLHCVSLKHPFISHRFPTIQKFCELPCSILDEKLVLSIDGLLPQVYIPPFQCL